MGEFSWNLVALLVALIVVIDFIAYGVIPYVKGEKVEYISRKTPHHTR